MRTPAVVRHRRAARIGIGVVITALIAAIAMRVYLTRTSASSPERIAGVSEPESEIIKQVNAERVRRGLKPLKFSARLAPRLSCGRSAGPHIRTTSAARPSATSNALACRDPQP